MSIVAPQHLNEFHSWKPSRMSKPTDNQVFGFGHTRPELCFGSITRVLGWPEKLHTASPALRMLPEGRKSSGFSAKNQ